MATLVCGVREALESINHMVHNQFKDPKVGNSPTQAIFLDPNGLSLRSFQSLLKVFVYLPPKETFFLYESKDLAYWQREDTLVIRRESGLAILPMFL